jgi:serine/threonine protein kinase
MMPDAQPPVVLSSQPDLTGRTLGDFHILRRIGTGGMGQVYLARQMSLKREVALKLLRNDLNTNDTALARFQAEAQAVAKLNHPNIVHIHQIGESDGLRYMVLEFVEGRNLRDYLARKGPPDVPIILSVMRQVSLALQKAHEQGIVHRDIKPENILITRKVEVKVTDFGLSRFFKSESPALNLTQSGITLGTPLYMSPEQVQGHTLDHRSDIYSFGVTCYHLLAGEPPFRGASAFEVTLKHVQEQPRPLSELRPDLPADLCGMVHKMMAKDPDDRHQSAREIIRDLVKVRDGLQVVTTQLATSRPAAPVNGTKPTLTTAVELSDSDSGSESALGSDPEINPDPDSDSKEELPAKPRTRSQAKAPVSRPASRVHWLVLAMACLLATAGGVCIYLTVQLASESRANANGSLPQPQTTQAQGLPDVHPPEKITTTRERELLVVLSAKGIDADDTVKASIELGLLYVKDHRLADATDRFERLKGKSTDWWRSDPVASRNAYLTSRLGLAVVLAHDNRAEASNKQFLEVISEPPPKFGPGGPKQDRSSAISWTLLRYPDLSHAVSDALNRNAANLGKTKLEPAALEQLRSPPRVGKKD